jgi:thiamine biosynthesis lipoprotein
LNIRTAALLLACASVARPAGHGPAVERFEFQQPHMGTTVRIVLYGTDERAARELAGRAFSRVAELDARLSDYLDSSELMALCRAAGGPPVAVSTDLFAVLFAAHGFSVQTQGAFDVTVGPLSRLWRRARARGELPEAAQLEEAQRRVGYRNMDLSSELRQVRLAEPGMLLDLGGIAKGYAADRALDVLVARGAPRALVAIGGDIVAGDAPPGTPGWEIVIAPLGTRRGVPVPSVTLRQAAISTSGDAEQYLEWGGEHYSHILQPATGSAVTGRRAVTVIARSGMTADALATAVKVLGAARGLPLVDDTPGAAGLVVEDTPSGPQQSVSKRWNR